MIAAVRVRGDVDARRNVSETLENMGLRRKNQCAVYEDSEAIKGMMRASKDFIAYGPINGETEERLAEANGGKLEHGDIVNLSPPSGGFRDTRRNSGQGGSLGKRDDMDDLIGRMV